MKKFFGLDLGLMAKHDFLLSNNITINNFRLYFKRFLYLRSIQGSVTLTLCIDTFLKCGI